MMDEGDLFRGGKNTGTGTFIHGKVGPASGGYGKK